MKLYFNANGIKEGAIKMLIVAGYIALSGAITALISWSTDMQATGGQWAIIWSVVNMLLAGLQKWLSTK